MMGVPGTRDSILIFPLCLPGNGACDGCPVCVESAYDL